MSDRAQQLYESADTQIGVLIQLISNADESVLRWPCAGREKLGDGTVGALAAHTAENYGRIARFLTATDRPSGGHVGVGPSGHGSVAPDDLLARLSAARDELTRIVELTDQELDTVPPKDSFRFCDGQRTLEQVLAGLMKHQEHQVQALAAAVTQAP
jgi:hypothetical protein